MTTITTKQVKLNLGCGKLIKPGYVNIDMRPLQGVDKTHDLFMFPWYWQEDNSVDEILLSHFVEHIPHMVRYHQFPNWNKDGFFVFFEECWRILKIGGIIEIWVPYYKSESTFRDPTHQRFITEHTFSYFWDNNPDKTFDYNIKARFEQVGNIEYLFWEPWDNLILTEPEKVWQALHSQWNVAHTMRIKIKKVPLQ